jgi:hypothetical protein
MIDFNNPHPANTDSSSRFNFDSFSNITDSSDSQHEKQNGPTISTDDGIMIEVNPDSENASSSICFNLELFSNTNDSSD